MTPDFLSELFFKGIQQTGPFPKIYLTHTFWMLLCCFLLAYATLLVILLTSLYRDTDKVRETIDADERLKICAAWAIFAVMAFQTGVLGWLYWRGVLPLQSSLWIYLRLLAAHLTALFVVFLVWLALYLSIRNDSKIAQRSLS